MTSFRVEVSDVLGNFDYETFAKFSVQFQASPFRKINFFKKDDSFYVEFNSHDRFEVFVGPGNVYFGPKLPIQNNIREQRLYNYVITLNQQLSHYQQKIYTLENHIKKLETRTTTSTTIPTTPTSISTTIPTTPTSTTIPTTSTSTTSTTSTSTSTQTPTTTIPTTSTSVNNSAIFAEDSEEPPQSPYSQTSNTSILRTFSLPQTWDPYHRNQMRRLSRLSKKKPTPYYPRPISNLDEARKTVKRICKMSKTPKKHNIIDLYISAAKANQAIIFGNSTGQYTRDDQLSDIGSKNLRSGALSKRSSQFLKCSRILEICGSGGFDGTGNSGGSCGDSCGDSCGGSCGSSSGGSGGGSGSSGSSDDSKNTSSNNAGNIYSNYLCSNLVPISLWYEPKIAAAQALTYLEESAQGAPISDDESNVIVGSSQ
jgi:hypothetical protein